MPDPEVRPSRAAIVAAFMALYLVWGSTYWAIAEVVDTLPPFLSGGARFVCAGALLFGWMRWRGAAAPTAAQWGSCTLIGILLFVGGNGGVCWAERWVPSGETSLIVASTPLWIATLTWLIGRSPPPSPTAWLGVVLGVVGVAALVWSPTAAAAGGHEMTGRGALIACSLSWSVGAVLSKSLPLPSSAFISSAAQMLCGGAAMVAAGAALGERVDPHAASAASLWALVYLVLIGSLVGFASFTFLLRWTSATSVSTYAFVNPLVAVALGALARHESLRGRQLLAAALILAAVAAILVPRRDPARAAAGGAAAPEPARR